MSIHFSSEHDASSVSARLAERPDVSEVVVFSPHDPEAVADAIVASPAAWTLRSLSFNAHHTGGRLAETLSRLPALEHLELVRIELREADLDVLAAAPFAERLTTLGITGRGDTRIDPAALERLLAATRSLRILSLKDVLDGGGLRTVAASAVFARLEALDVARSTVDAASLDALAMAHAPSLKELRLGEKTIDVASAAALGGASWLRGLRLLSLDYAKLTDEGLAGLLRAQMPQLEVLGLSSCPVGDAGAALLAASNLPALTTLNLVRCAIGEQGASALAESELISHLTTLYLGSNPIGDPGAIALSHGRGQSLVTLDLSRCEITARGARALAASETLPRGADVRLTDNPLGGKAGAAALAALANRARSAELVLSGQQLDDDALEAMVQRGAFEGVVRLHLDSNPAITDAGIAALVRADLRALRHLDLSDLQIGSGAAHALASAERLGPIESLSVARTRIVRGGGLELLAKSPAFARLTSLDAGATGIGGPAPAALAAFPSLRWVSVELCDLDDDDLEALRSAVPECTIQS